ncbi:hypothetical protein TNCV_4276021 [Trichonephila clavipes]|nr:hypothetical protein TNCV_4276021 [Trichonephila clavipes]
MPLSRMENTTFAMPSIIDSHDMGLRTVYSPDAQKKTPIKRFKQRAVKMGPGKRSKTQSRFQDVDDSVCLRKWKSCCSKDV